ncbi:lysine-specific histone demethylase 1, putative, partial [Hepatocystis sp. ex Piliocolobus tephrosceles]
MGEEKENFNNRKCVSNSYGRFLNNGDVNYEETEQYAEDQNICFKYNEKKTRCKNSDFYDNYNKTNSSNNECINSAHLYDMFYSYLSKSERNILMQHEKENMTTTKKGMNNISNKFHFSRLLPQLLTKYNLNLEMYNNKLYVSLYFGDDNIDMIIPFLRKEIYFKKKKEDNVILFLVKKYEVADVLIKAIYLNDKIHSFVKNNKKINELFFNDDFKKNYELYKSIVNMNFFFLRKKSPHKTKYIDNDDDSTKNDNVSSSLNDHDNMTKKKCSSNKEDDVSSTTLYEPNFNYDHDPNKIDKDQMVVTPNTTYLINMSPMSKNIQNTEHTSTCKISIGDELLSYDVETMGKNNTKNNSSFLHNNFSPQFNDLLYKKKKKNEYKTKDDSINKHKTDPKENNNLWN